MGNQIAFCCKKQIRAEGTEINRLNYDNEEGDKKHREKFKFQEHIDKTKSSNLIRIDEPISIIQNKSQDIFDNTTHLFAIFPNSSEYVGNEDFADETIQKAKDYQERYTSLYHSYVPKANEDLEKNGVADFLKNKSVYLKEFYVNTEDKDKVDLEEYIGQKAVDTRRKHGAVKEDKYLKEHFDSYFDTNNFGVSNGNGLKGVITLPAVFIDKARKDEIYCGSWHLNRDVEMNEKIQNLKSVMKFSGFGIYIKDDKSVVEGIFREGELNGPGRVILANGDLFKGLYTNGFLNDKGVFVDFAGNIYDGQFKLNIMDGYGEEIFIDNSTFKGEYKRNKKNGKGKFVWADGSFYEGDLLDNNLHGKGTYQWASGLRYEGEWARGVMQGKGIFTTSNGEYYEGEFKDNKKDGFGLFWWNEKKYYLGFWQDGVQHGYGKYIKGDKLMIGQWNKGKFEKHMEKEQIKFPNFNFNKRVVF